MMRIIAHRGASGQAPENTLVALQRAAELGAKWVEVDVQRTSDGVLVLVHDDTWERTTAYAGDIAATPWSKVQGLDAGAWFDGAFAGEHPPRLDEVLHATASSLQLNLEIKSPENHPRLAAEIVELVRRAGAIERVLLTCFDHGVVDTLAEFAPDFQLGYLASRPPLGADTRVGTWALRSDWVESDPDLVRQAHAAGREVIVWTVDDVERAARLEQLGVDGLITNYPERFVTPRGDRLPLRAPR
jgi:glycerophosphoryl diester phosphodiesterase